MDVYYKSAMYIHARTQQNMVYHWYVDIPGFLNLASNDDAMDVVLPNDTAATLLEALELDQFSQASDRIQAGEFQTLLPQDKDLVSAQINHVFDTYGNALSKDVLMNFLKCNPAPAALENPLRQIVMFGDPDDRLQHVLNAGGSIDCKDDAGLGLMSYAFWGCNPNMIEKLRKVKSDWSASFTSIHAEIALRRLCVPEEGEMDTEATDEDIARMVSFALEYGADPCAPFDVGEDPPFILAVINGHKAVVKVLVKWMKDPNVIDSNGLGPAYHAAAREDIDIMRILMSSETRLSLDEVDHRGRNAVYMAVNTGKVDLANLMLHYAGGSFPHSKVAAVAVKLDDVTTMKLLLKLMPVDSIEREDALREAEVVAKACNKDIVTDWLFEKSYI